jgi:indolepyruvate ferredoxin oxidoreductase beta subunit
MSNSADGQRAITILVAALGGEGGGVLCEWLVDAARRAGYPVQGTSIPGVAQRTGATTYYVEIFPVPLALLGERRPILGLAPVPGAVDLLIASEPLEAARLAQAGLIDRARTIVICSNERALTNAEKMAQGDGRRELEQLEAAVRAQAREHLVLPMQTLARSGKTLISAVMLGAIAASGVLPFARSFCEEAIGSAGRGAAASRAGFALGEAAVGTRGSITPVPTSGGAGPVSRPPLPQWCRDLVGGFPGSLREVLDAGLALVADYQGRAYVELYLARLVRVLHLERTLDTLGSHDFGLTRETARFLALWMCFEDVPRVADLKSRRARFARMRAEVGASPGATVRVSDYFKPRLEETLSLLPAAWQKKLEALLRRGHAKGRQGAGRAITLKSDTLFGLLALRTLAALAILRPYSARYVLEQQRIMRWLDAIETVAQDGWQAAYQIALCGRLVKGYGETNARAHANLERILTTFEDSGRRSALAARFELASEIALARDNALADPEGQTLDRQIAAHGIAARPIAVKPLVFVRPGKTR